MVFLIFFVFNVVVVDWIVFVLGILLFCIVFMYWNVCFDDLWVILNVFILYGKKLDRVLEVFVKGIILVKGVV